MLLGILMGSYKEINIFGAAGVISDTLSKEATPRHPSRIIVVVALQFLDNILILFIIKNCQFLKFTYIVVKVRTKVVINNFFFVGLLLCAPNYQNRKSLYCWLNLARGVYNNRKESLWILIVEATRIYYMRRRGEFVAI